jgi:hypothetical protein
VRPTAIEMWLNEQHPYWADESRRPSRRGPWVETFLLGVAYHMRLVQATRDASGAWSVRLSAALRGID